MNPGSHDGCLISKVIDYCASQVLPVRQQGNLQSFDENEENFHLHSLTKLLTNELKFGIHSE